jgi:hypothetical protein
MRASSIPPSSAAVSPWARSAVRKAASCGGTARTAALRAAAAADGGVKGKGGLVVGTVQPGP